MHVELIHCRMGNDI